MTSWESYESILVPDFTGIEYFGDVLKYMNKGREWIVKFRFYVSTATYTVKDEEYRKVRWAAKQYMESICCFIFSKIYHVRKDGNCFYQVISLKRIV